MKVYFLVLIILIFCDLSFGQIVVNQNDMPNVGDTFRLSTKVLPSFDPALTGEDYLWDFSALVKSTQSVDTFLSVIATSIEYNLVFNSFLDNYHKAKVALRQPDRNIGAQIALTEVFDFYKESSQLYGQIGFAAKINGVATPVKYDSVEVLYKFPLEYSNLDSSNISYGLSIPTYGYYGQDVKRVNKVDGWGVLTTPYGAFNVLRMKSVVYNSDTLYYNQFQYGNRINTQVTEYKWIAKEFVVPLLQINVNSVSKTAVFIDSIAHVNSLNSSVLEQLCENIIIYSNPTENEINISNLPEGWTYVEIYNILGECVLKKKNNKTLEFKIDNIFFKEGVYIVAIHSNKGLMYQKKIFIS
ncbi:MAG: T9SS type A sorting domain-containing protein [Bacteroidota bacterium]